MTYAFAAVLIFLTMIINYVMTDQGSAVRAQTEVASIGDSMKIYANYATQYAVANPTYTGTPAVAALNLPTWYNAPPKVATYIQTGKAYTYYNGTYAALPAYLVNSLQNGYAAGINGNGVLQSPVLPSSATASYIIPAAVPNGSIVLMP